MGSWNWKGENNKNYIVNLRFLFFLDLKHHYCYPRVVFSDLFHVCVPGETADIAAAAAEAEDEGHQKPRSLQSPK